MNVQNPTKLNTKEAILRAMVDEISIPPHLDEIARSRYRAIGDWLDRGDSKIKHLDPKISPQGSFMLGTVNRPVGDRDAYDIDVVCKLKNSDRHNFSQAELKAVVGREIIAYAKAHSMNQMPANGRRCWTLEYADQASFHMDILPCIPDEVGFRASMSRDSRVFREAMNQIASTAIAITDKKHPGFHVRDSEWLISNPRGYGRWFRRRQAAVLEGHRQNMLARGKAVASVEDVPNYKVRTPLQDAIKLLKRHRDVMFDGDKDKPISVIISTLAAHAYDGEGMLVDALGTILKRMPDFIENRGGVAWVANPAYPLENFADKWAETPRKAENFRAWLRQAGHDFGTYLQASRYDQLPAGLVARMTETTMAKLRPRIAAMPAAIIRPAEVVLAETCKVMAEGMATRPWLP